MGHDLPRTRKAVVDAVAEQLNESPHTVMGSYWKIKRDGAPYVARYRARAASVKKPRKKR